MSGQSGKLSLKYNLTFRKGAAELLESIANCLLSESLRKSIS